MDIWELPEFSSRDLAAVLVKYKEDGADKCLVVCSAYLPYAHNMCKDQPEKKIKRKDFLLRIARDLVTPFVTQRYKLPTLPRNIRTATVMCGFVSDSEENTMQDLEDYETISRK
jgi:hypothetical protein